MDINELIASSMHKFEAKTKSKEKHDLSVDNKNLFEAINKLNSSFLNGMSVRVQSVDTKNTYNLTDAVNKLNSSIEILNFKKKEYTRLINKKRITASNGYSILKFNGHGKVRELTVSLDIKPDLFIKVNGSELYNIHASFDDLATISEYSDSISAIVSATGTNYIINVKDIKFTESIDISLFFSGSSTINNVFCIYDLIEE